MASSVIDTEPKIKRSMLRALLPRMPLHALYYAAPLVDLPAPMPPLFRDFGKAAVDLLDHQSFDASDHKVELSTLTKDTAFAARWSLRGASAIETEFLLPNNMSLAVGCGSDSSVSAALKSANVLGFPGVAFTAASSSANKLLLGVDYLHSLGTFSVEADHDLAHGPVFSASATIAQRNFLVGGAARILPVSGIADYEVGAGYEERGTFEISTKYSGNMEKATPPQVQFQYIHFARPDLAYAARFVRSLEEAPKTGVEFGAVYAASVDTKIGTKISSKAQVSVFTQHALGRGVTLTQSLGIDARHASGPHQYGLGLKFSA